MESLETFLGGMETLHELLRYAPHTDLETFLGGMETRHRLRRSKRFSPLKPSLVEWKLDLEAQYRRTIEP